MNNPKLVFVLLLSISSSNCLAFGQTGHRITGKIAENYLTEHSQLALKKIIPTESLAEISTYVDEMRSDPAIFWKKTSKPFHYVTVPEKQSYIDIGSPEKGDAVSALKMYSKILKDKHSNLEQQKMALKFIVHIIGDLHQPFHSGNGEDYGGNDLKVEFYWKDSNMHRVWDSGMIKQKSLSFTEWANWLNKKITPHDISDWNQIDPVIWINESVSYREAIYPKSDKLNYSYTYENMPLLKTRLQQAGVRIATYLNDIFKD